MSGVNSINAISCATDTLKLKLVMSRGCLRMMFSLRIRESANIAPQNKITNEYAN